MKNVNEFHIIGRVGDITDFEKVTFLSVASDKNFKKDGEWKTVTSWNKVTGFDDNVRDRMKDASKGDLVRMTGSLRQSKNEVNGETQYNVDLIADGFAILARKASSSEAKS